MLGAIGSEDGPAPASERPVTGADEAPLTTDENRLFAALKAKRLDLARAKKVPPYVIFSDRTLREIARAKPSDAVALGRIHGIGPAKVQSYGTLVFDVLGRHHANG